MSLKTPNTIEAIPKQWSISPDYCLRFVKKRHGRYRFDPENQSRLRNSLLAAVGFFELANAGDFAANVWNQVPAPKYAIALMAVGGTMALFMTYFAYRDARLSWFNLKGLRTERRHLLRTLEEVEAGNEQQQTTGTFHVVNALLDVNRREMGTEIIDRIGMDSLMGFGALMVGVGALLAIDGADHHAWQASNLLSGYIGNAPMAIYGLVNLLWSIYVWLRARRHGIAYAVKQSSQDDGIDATVGVLLTRRIHSVQLHATLNGVTGVVAGAASLVTATMWWGYVVLIPCITISVIVNYLWRHRLGYDRPLFIEQLPIIDEASLIEELKHINAIQQVLLSSKKSKSKSTSTSTSTSTSLSSSLAAFSGAVSDPQSFSSTLDFMARHELLEDFCLRVLNDKELSARVFDHTTDPNVTVYPCTLASVDDESVTRRLHEVACLCIDELGLMHLKYRERYLLETLGCYMTGSAGSSKFENAV
ncbi:hypothetical protein UA08_06277 [Talaromyces atroroseus]|uniref:Integral membrane protein n=1 Tax=Talaromyces atroroseus TaxID=1441469 RepID=A0A225AC56_TALAT|nr:hypothetical protein UA08_06277 [Talaromyces atroroseus]OKL58691.1 hypothetical protein UA08_06277 [Talaromyces atroroseus]